MKREYEASDLSVNMIEARPGELLCAHCKFAGAGCPLENEERVQELVDAICKDSQVHIKLRTAFDDVGGRTDLYDKTTPSQRRRDLEILRLMGEVPESIRTAFVWTRLLDEYLPDVSKVCAPNEVPSEVWPNCPNANADYYVKGRATLCPTRDTVVMACDKESSCKMIEESNHLTVRAHHLMCMTGFLARTDRDKPLAVDNLYEIWQKIVENPLIPITLIEGPGDCMVCPPCYGYNPESKLCFMQCSLRDRKKDLEVFARLGLKPGDTLPARELLYLYYKKIKSVDGICRFEERRGYDWRNCRSMEDTSYQTGMEYIAETLGFED